MTSIADEVDLILDDDQNTIDSAAKLFENCSKMQQIARALNQTKTPKKWTQTAQEKHEQ